MTLTPKPSGQPQPKLAPPAGTAQATPVKGAPNAQEAAVQDAQKWAEWLCTQSPEVIGLYGMLHSVVMGEIGLPKVEEGVLSLAYKWALWLDSLTDEAVVRLYGAHIAVAGAAAEARQPPEPEAGNDG